MTITVSPPCREHTPKCCGRMLCAMPHRVVVALGVACVLSVAVGCRTAPEPAAQGGAIDRDLLDVTIPQLRRFYADKKYTVTQVVRWHLDRIDRYNGVYGAIETVLRASALAEAKRQDDFPQGLEGNQPLRL